MRKRLIVNSNAYSTVRRNMENTSIATTTFNLCKTNMENRINVPNYQNAYADGYSWIELIYRRRNYLRS